MSEHRLIIDFRGTESQKDAATGKFIDYAGNFKGSKEQAINLIRHERETKVRTLFTPRLSKASDKSARWFPTTV